ncbi:hypothetical protein BCT65_018670 [Vibrio splendidus]|uniref:hypothetical protein n=1 Tax=Vibrio splendidus TaxID=29497 RepID=UPI0010544F67|nr:hypothetical protein [Vibrio splendidus]MCC5519066.1 hypothetical protein [Vibrio splendidus]
MIEYIVLAFSLIAAILAIVDFFSGFIKYKLLVFVLAALLAGSTLYQFYAYQKQNSKEVIVQEMKRHAKIVADSILISGWEETGDYLGYLTQITGFYTTYGDFYPIEAETYQNELKDWREYFSEKRKARETIYPSEISPMEGLVKSGEEHLVKIAENNS